MTDSINRSLEVELKFVAPDLTAVRTTLVGFGAKLKSETRQRDEYFAHPCRDFKVTDEALRIRSYDHHRVMTYKGPKAISHAKIREEVEFAFPESSDHELHLILARLGFRALAVVAKRRESWGFTHNGWELNIELDDVEQLGTFVEIETLARSETQAEAEAAVIDLARVISLGGSTKLSYLALLLGRQPE